MIDEIKGRRNFAANLRARMEELSLSQSELARRANVKQPQISEYIRGNQSPSLFAALRIAEAVSLSIEDLCVAPLAQAS
ncbi:helix-turn-helix protein [Planctomycetes bacterium Pan216]|uniref:Helix-turn-helix protein n=1 Tax=Kolteria novifilia TaxID=2527975 RepID=A0A518B573_9BACT|nr:helix-turn-helix protein [Planctomycetes bacterium Pan216]